jgi:hypothetical protein
LQSVGHKCTKDNIIKYIRLKKDENPYQTIDVAANRASGNEKVVIMIDDAQNAVKDISLSERIRFIVASTYLIGGQDSPFSILPRITPD